MLEKKRTSCKKEKRGNCMPKKEVSVEYLRSLTLRYIELLHSETENSTEWAYVMLEPDLLADATVTLAFFRTLGRKEFEALGPYYEDVMQKWKDSALVNLLEDLYSIYYGENRDTEFYREFLCGLRKYTL